MSTRCTITHNNEFHLYQECFEKDNVYLQLDGDGWDASIHTAMIDWRDGESKRPQLHLRMDVSLWRKIVDGWASSQWGQHPETDHEKADFDPDATLIWVKKYNENKEPKNE